MVSRTRAGGVVAVLSLVTAFVVAGYLVAASPSASSAGKSQRTARSSSSPPSTPPSAHPTWPSVPGGIEPAVGAFLTAWSTRDADARRALLAHAATPTLAKELALTEPAKVPASCFPVGPVQIAERSRQAVLVSVATSCAGTLWLALVEDAAADHGWLVSAIGKERSWIQ